MRIECERCPDEVVKKRIASAVKAERERCLMIVENLCRIMSSEYTDPNPKYNTVEKAREFAAMMSEIARDAIADGHVPTTT